MKKVILLIEFLFIVSGGSRDVRDAQPFLVQFYAATRMHSIRIRTASSSSRLLGGGCLPQCMLGYPLGVGLEIPQARPLNFPPGCGPGDPPVPSPPL